MQGCGTERVFGVAQDRQGGQRAVQRFDAHGAVRVDQQGVAEAVRLGMGEHRAVG